MERVIAVFVLILAVIFYKFLRGRVLFLYSAWVYVGSMLGLSWVYVGSILGTLWVIVYQNTNETLTIYYYGISSIIS